MPIVESNYMIVNFFTASHVWFHSSKEWVKKNGTNGKCKLSLDSQCETQWYSMTKVCLSVDAYEYFFFQLKENAGTDENHPSIKGTILQAIDKCHFANNADLLQAITPIVDVIGLLESPFTTIASIYLVMIQLYNLYTGLKGNKFVDHVKTCLTKRFEQYFCHTNFPISIFLWPQYQDFSLSKSNSANWITKEVIQLAILWNFTTSECIAVNQSLQMYIATKENDFMLGLDPISFCKTTSKFDSSLRCLATGHHDIQN